MSRPWTRHTKSANVLKQTSLPRVQRSMKSDSASILPHSRMMWSVSSRSAMASSSRSLCLLRSPMTRRELAPMATRNADMGAARSDTLPSSIFLVFLATLFMFTLFVNHLI